MSSVCAQPKVAALSAARFFDCTPVLALADQREVKAWMVRRISTSGVKRREGSDYRFEFPPRLIQIMCNVRIRRPVCYCTASSLDGVGPREVEF
jgi:hypothetical protein